MQITKSKTKITEYFTGFELFTKSEDFAGKSHFLDDNVIKGLEFIREYYGVPLLVTSTFRTEHGNLLAGGKSASYHLQGKAIDFQTEDNKSRSAFVRQFKKDYFEKDSELKNTLDFYGVHGVFFYDTFIHIDTRTAAATADYSTVKGNISVLLVLLLVFLAVSNL